jgi:hypothetical protein
MCAKGGVLYLCTLWHMALYEAVIPAATRPISERSIRHARAPLEYLSRNLLRRFTVPQAHSGATCNGTTYNPA